MKGPHSSAIRTQLPKTIDVEEVTASLAAEMIDRWRQGERPLPEEFLNRQPDLWNQPAAAAELIYEELCLRQEFGPVMPAAQVLERFPQWRQQLELLFDCQSVLGPRAAAPQFPGPGESIGDFLLQAELGRGAHGRVYLAQQKSLSCRLVVLKLVSTEECEHLLLARLQHTHIVPLYSAENDPVRDLRCLCMPYFGGASLARLLDLLHPCPPVRRTGRDLVNALDRAARAQAAASENRSLIGAAEQFVSQSAARLLLSRCSYVQAICWIGACLADALQYAHERNLVHLDLKPSNILLAADGQPMLLDFHLARAPINPPCMMIQRLGGTPGYMSPEQTAAAQAVKRGHNVPQAVDGRSDIYSLGIVLFEALGGLLPDQYRLAPQLRELNEKVSPGLADIVGRCLADEPNRRYPAMGAVANDLRRHLADLPLVGVRNRSSQERWRKWRRRRPNGLTRVGMLLTVITALVGVALGGASLLLQRTEQVQSILKEARVQEANGEWQAAVRGLQHARTLASTLPFGTALVKEMQTELRAAEEGRAEAQRTACRHSLHELANRLRFLPGSAALAPGNLHKLHSSCRELWNKRDQIAAQLSSPRHSLEPGVREDLLDIVLFWTEMQMQLVRAPDREPTRRLVLAELAQAEALCEPSAVLDEARRQRGDSLQPSRREAKTAWEHCTLGRLFLRTGAVDRAVPEFRQAVRLEPQGLWPNFYQGLCAYRQSRFDEAVTSFSVCIGAAPEGAVCFYNRGRSYAALGNAGKALDDYEQALRLDPKLVPAIINRALLQIRLGRYAEMWRELWRAGSR
jgi:serine/threonine protein kinase